ncbi:MAG: Uma2 family endonuclease [Planctomycetota bacterium]|nr:Uma2 family endonuclease [Planctomycetota bacterium]
MSIIQALLTADDLQKIPRGQARHELVCGELTTMSPAGFEHGLITMELATSLQVFVKKRKLGRVFAAETGFLIERNPDTVRAPDIAFVTSQKFASTARKSGYWPGVPDLAVEVVSPTDLWSEVQSKALMWLEAGVRLVWIVDPRQKQVTVFESRENITALKSNQTLTAPALLPGFSLQVSEIFES